MISDINALPTSPTKAAEFPKTGTKITGAYFPNPPPINAPAPALVRAAPSGPSVNTVPPVAIPVLAHIPRPGANIPVVNDVALPK